VQEQLLKALVECLSLTDSRLSIHPQYRSFLLSDILMSVPKEVLSTTLTTIRKEILTRYVERALRERIQLVPTSEDTLEVQPSPSSDCFPTLLAIFTFIHDRLLPSLPDVQRNPFASSFYVGLSEAIQTNLLVRSIPDDGYGLAPYLALIRSAINFESQVIKMGFFSGVEHRIQAWGDGAQSHYEKKRRATLVDKARLIILTDNHAPTRVTLKSSTDVVAEEAKQEPSTEKPEEDVNWDFDDEESNKPKENGKPSKQEAAETPSEEPEEGADGWGFEDEDEALDGTAAKEGSSDPWGVDWDDDAFQEPKDTRPMAEAKPSFSSKSTAGQSFQTAASAPKSPMPRALTESYLVSHAAISVAELAGQILDEATTLLKST
jgi:protein transport protein DSL1/ZW10